MIAKNISRNQILGEQVTQVSKRHEVRRGLLNHSELKNGEGLWLNPCGSVHTFFMKFAIDVVYLSREQKVLKVVPEMWPWNISFAPWSTWSVLELPMGVCRTTQTEIGDRLSIE